VDKTVQHCDYSSGWILRGTVRVRAKIRLFSSGWHVSGSSLLVVRTLLNVVLRAMKDQGHSSVHRTPRKIVATFGYYDYRNTGMVHFPGHIARPSVL